MNKTPLIAKRLLLLAALFVFPVLSGLCAEETATLTVPMEDCLATRPGRMTSGGVLVSIFLGIPDEKLVKRGTVEVDGQKFMLYLPEAKIYSLKNTGESDDSFENTSTLISVDQNGDGKFTKADGWFANVPMRLGDKMFDVIEIAHDGSRVVLKPSKSPLHGAIVGRVCPSFSFKTAEGKEISRENLAGRAFLIDVWSVTWHVCIEEFPLVQRVQQKVGADKLAVVLVDVDEGYFDEAANFLPRAAKILKERNLEWPNALAPTGPNNTFHTFNLSGYGNIIVDAKGIVRGVDVRGQALENLVMKMTGKTQTDQAPK